MKPRGLFGGARADIVVAALAAVMVLLCLTVRLSRVDVKAIRVSPERVDFGSVPVGQTLDTTIVVANYSAEDVRVRAIPSCSCSVVGNRVLRLPALKSAEVPVTVHTSGKIGYQRTFIQFRGSAGNNLGAVELRFVGIAPVLVDPPFLTLTLARPTASAIIFALTGSATTKVLCSSTEPGMIVETRHIRGRMWKVEASMVAPPEHTTAWIAVEDEKERHLANILVVLARSPDVDVRFGTVVYPGVNERKRIWALMEAGTVGLESLRFTPDLISIVGRDRLPHSAFEWLLLEYPSQLSARDARCLLRLDNGSVCERTFRIP